MLTKQETLLGSSARAESSRVREPGRTALPHGSAVLGFMVMGLVYGLSLANHTDSGSFLVARASLSQDGFQREGFCEVGRTYELASSPFDLSQILPVGGSLLVPLSLPGPPVVG